MNNDIRAEARRLNEYSATLPETIARGQEGTRQLAATFQRLDANLPATGLARKRKDTLINLGLLSAIVLVVIFILAEFHVGVF